MPQRLTWLLPAPEQDAPLSQQHKALAQAAWQSLLDNVGTADPVDTQQLHQQLTAEDRALTSCTLLYPRASLQQRLRLSALLDLLRQPGASAARVATFVLDSQVCGSDCVCLKSQQCVALCSLSSGLCCVDPSLPWSCLDLHDQLAQRPRL
jgi:hypothetical protein